MKLGKKRRESSTRNYYIISPRVIVKAIIIKYLFTQKAPSRRILRLFEFLADYTCIEIKYVRGPENVVPDFLSRPWDPAPAQSPIHVLVARHTTPSCLFNGRYKRSNSLLQHS